MPYMNKIFLPVSRGDVSQTYAGLIQRYPLLFRALRNPDSHPSDLAKNGINCGLGWYSLIDDTCTAIEKELLEALARINEPDTVVDVEHRLQRTAPIGVADTPWNATHPSVLIPYCKAIYSEKGMLNIVLTQGYLAEYPIWHRIRDAVDLAYVTSLIICEECGRRERRKCGSSCVDCELRAFIRAPNNK